MNIGIKLELKEIILSSKEKKLELILLKKFGMEMKKKQNLM